MANEAGPTELRAAAEPRGQSAEGGATAPASSPGTAQSAAGSGSGQGERDPSRDVQPPSGSEAQSNPSGANAKGQGTLQSSQGAERQASQLLPRGSAFDAAWSANPFGMLSRMMADMERFFDDVGFGRSRFFGGMRPSEMPGIRAIGAPWVPQIEVSERDGELCVRADLPGMRKEDVKVNLSEDALTIEGERREQRESRGYSERAYGSFYRTIPLPEGVQADGAQAKFEDGVLEVTLPLPQCDQQKRRQLEVK